MSDGQKNILIINGHPDAKSYNSALADAYQKGANASGADMKTINIRDLDFNPNLQYRYRQRTELEPDLLQVQELILWESARLGLLQSARSGFRKSRSGRNGSGKWKNLV